MTLIRRPTVYSEHVLCVAERLSQPSLPRLINQFLYDQLYAREDHSSEDVPEEQWPQFHDRVSVYLSAKAVFYAPTELAGISGMHSEIIRSNPSWRGEYDRRDTVLINLDPSEQGFRSMIVGRVRAFITFTFDTEHYPCALVEWFLRQEDTPDVNTGMWVVEPEILDGERVVGLVHIDSIVRAVHLMPVYRNTQMPHDFHFSYSLDAFTCFYVNSYADYHSHECLTDRTSGKSFRANQM